MFDLAEVEAELKLWTYKPNTTFRVFGAGGFMHEAWFLGSKTIVDDVDGNGKTTFETQTIIPEFSNIEEGMQYAMEEITWIIEQHERDEWLRRNGIHNRNPHEEK